MIRMPRRAVASPPGFGCCRYRKGPCRPNCRLARQHRRGARRADFTALHTSLVMAGHSAIADGEVAAKRCENGEDRPQRGMVPVARKNGRSGSQ